MPLPLTVSCFSKIQIGFTFLVPAHPGGLGKRAVCVCVPIGKTRDATLGVGTSDRLTTGFDERRFARRC